MAHDRDMRARDVRYPLSKTHKWDNELLMEFLDLDGMQEWWDDLLPFGKGKAIRCLRVVMVDLADNPREEGKEGKASPNGQWGSEGNAKQWPPPVWPSRRHSGVKGNKKASNN